MTDDGYHRLSGNALAVSPEWQAIADDNGFLAVRDDLAVIVADPSAGPRVWDLPEIVAMLGRALAKAGHDHAAIAVATPGLRLEDEERVFAAGASVVSLPLDFFGQTREQQVRGFDALLPDEPPEADLPSLPSGRGGMGSASHTSGDPSPYSGRSPFLTAKEIDEWQRTVEDDPIDG